MTAIEEAIAGGIYRFILDLRGNEGGDIAPWARPANAIIGDTLYPDIWIEAQYALDVAMEYLQRRRYID